MSHHIIPYIDLACLFCIEEYWSFKFLFLYTFLDRTQMKEKVDNEDITLISTCSPII